MRGEFAKMIRDLLGELPRGGQDEGPGFSPGLTDQPVKDGEKEGGGLAASRHGGGHDVAALEKGRDGQLLDRRGR